jgi:hypothetical protein
MTSCLAWPPSPSEVAAVSQGFLEELMSKLFTLLSFFDIFMENLLMMDTSRSNNYLLYWIEKKQSWGKYVFCLQEVKTDFPDISEQALVLSLSRLSSKGRVLSVYKGFH